MRRLDAINILSAHQGALRERGIRSLALFGSIARDEAGANSDVDLLVEFDGPATFDRYFELKELLESLLDRPIDLVTRSALKPAIRDRVEQEAIRVA